MEVITDDLTRLSTRLEILERRVYALEHPSEEAAPLPEQAESQSAAKVATREPQFAQTAGMFSVVGKAMLGIAGAYVLRALAESGSLPKLAVVVTAIAYAGIWLIWAARLPEEALFARTTFATTSALILAPMLWELTLRFNVLPAWTTAAVLAAYVMLALFLARKHDLESIFWIANVTALLESLALLMATRNMIPFIWALLTMAMIVEFSAARGRKLGVRALVAFAADLAICALIFIYYDPTNVPLNYSAVTAASLLAPGIVLLLIYAGSDAYQTSILHRPISVFETGQAVIAFLLAALSVLRFGSSVGGPALGAFCLFFAAAGYTAVFIYFDRSPEQRNYHVYATGSAALLVAGSYMVLPSPWLALCLALISILVTYFGVRTLHLTLEFHGLMYLAAAAYTAGLLNYVYRALVGNFPAAPSLTNWIVVVSAILCYALADRYPGDEWKQRIIHVVAATFAVSGTSALVIFALMRISEAIMITGPHLIAFVRTLAICAVALTLAYCGSRWQRKELAWIAYATLVFVSAKLLFEDLRHGQLVFIAASIFLFAVTLILVPRLIRPGQRGY